LELAFHTSFKTLNPHFNVRIYLRKILSVEIINFAILKNVFQYIRQASAAIVASLILISTIGVNLELHVCNNTVKDYSFIGNAEACGEMEAQCTTESLPIGINKAPCCTNENIYSPSVFYSNTSLIQEKTNVEFIVPFALETKTFLVKLTQTSNYLLRPPPDLNGPDANILHQSFLI
jgi:hypothetical protein